MEKGKYAESKVQAFLEKYAAKHQDFDWERRYDARSAGGRMQRQTYDYAVFSTWGHGGIEVKEVGHAFRLPHANFEISQVAKLRKREMAGGRVVVLICHMPTQAWRLVPLAPFIQREGGSWDLRPWVAYDSCTSALDSTGFFP